MSSPSIKGVCDALDKSGRRQGRAPAANGCRSADFRRDEAGRRTKGYTTNAVIVSSPRPPAPARTTRQFTQYSSLSRSYRRLQVALSISSSLSLLRLQLSGLVGAEGKNESKQIYSPLSFSS